jgi:hypothetical protein
VWGFFVACGVLRGPVDLNQQKAIGITLPLEDVEANDAGLVHAVAGVLEDCGPEGVCQTGLHLDVDMDDDHGGGLPWRRMKERL